MIDTSKMTKSEYEPERGELRPLCNTLHQAAEIIGSADQTPDEAVKAPLLAGAKQMIQNVIEAIDGRQSAAGQTDDNTDDD